MQLAALLEYKAADPTAVQYAAVEFVYKADLPTAVLLLTVFACKAFPPTATQSVPVWFEVKASWVDLLQLVLITVIGAYFGGRSLEKVKK